MAPGKQSRRMRPRDILFTQDSIGSRFTDGKYLSDTFEQLLNGRISVDEVERIEVVEDRSLYWALTGNRRLYLYRKLEDLGEVNTIPVRVMSMSDYDVSRRFNDRYTTDCEGRDIEMRQHAAEGYINRAVHRWRQQRPTLNTRYRNETTSRFDATRHLPTGAFQRETSVERNYNSNRRMTSNREERGATNRNDNEILITTQPFNRTGFQSSAVAELLRHGSIHSVEPHSTTPVEPAMVHTRIDLERSVQPGSNRSVQPGSNRSASSRHPSQLKDIFYDGCGPNPVGPLPGSLRSSSSVQSSPRRPPLPTDLDRSNSTRTADRMDVGVVSGGTVHEATNDVVTNQPRSSTDPARGSNRSVQPGSNRSASSRHRSQQKDIFYDGCGPNPVASLPGSVRSSSSVQSSPRRPPFHTNLDRSNSTRITDRMGVGVVSGGTEQETGNDVVTYQPRSSTDPVRGSDEHGHYRRSCCSRCC